MAEMTRDEMLGVIQRGESVIHRGRLLTSADHVPGEAELAKGDPAKEAAAREALQARIAALQAEVDLLSAPRAEPVKAEAEAEAPVAKPADEPLPLPEPKPKGK